MTFQHLPSHRVRGTESRYCFCQVTDWDAEDSALIPLRSSIQKLGILHPLLVHPIGETFHLVDGFKRAAIAPALGIERLPCHLLPEGISPEEILEILLVEHRPRICATFASKARFIGFALGLGIGKEPLVQRFFPWLGLQEHEAVLRKVEAITRLPEEVLGFCEEKGFSMRQCDQLTRYPRDLLLAMFSWRDAFSLTASIVEELLGHLHDYLRGTDQSLPDFLGDPEVQTLLASPLRPQEKTERLRALIRARRYPLLMETNRQLQRIRAQMDLPRNVELDWDPTLERREVQLVLKLREPEEWEETLQGLQDERIAQGICHLLEVL